MSGPNWPGSYPGAIGTVAITAQASFWLGGQIYAGITRYFDMSPGRAAYLTFSLNRVK